MRYVRFFKTPRIVDEGNASKAHIYALITLTSDLGDSFLPCDVTLSAELWLDGKPKATPEISKKVEWKSYMRCLPVILPLGRRSIGWPARLRVGVESSAGADDLDIYQDYDLEIPAIVSVWSASIDPKDGKKEAEKRIERRFVSAEGRTTVIWEETGESIARHIWY